MGRRVAIALYLIVMIAVVVGVDLLFLRDNFWPRLLVNIGIVVIFSAFYLRFLQRK